MATPPPPPPPCVRGERPLRHLAAEHLQHQRRELHAVLGLEGERAVLLGVLLVQAAQVGQLLDHLGVEEAAARVVDPDVGLQRLRQPVLQLLDAPVVLDAGTVCGRGRGSKIREVAHRLM